MEEKPKVGITFSALSGMMAAEDALKRREAKSLENVFPEGHPLKAEVEKQKEMLGDLSGLPSGHPLLLQLEAAKEQYKIKQQKEKEQQKAAPPPAPDHDQIKKAKKINEDTARRNARTAEEAATNLRIGSAREVNGALDKTLQTVKELYAAVEQNEQNLNTEPNSRARVIRLKRLLFVAERGLSECRMKRM